MQAYYQVIPIRPDVYRLLSADGSATELIIGTKQAAVIDTGYGLGDLKGAIRAITDLPLIVFNTHGHCDHIGGNFQFDEPIHMGREDIPTCEYTNGKVFRQIMIDRMRQSLPDGFDADAYLAQGYGHPVACGEGEAFDLGGMLLRVYNASGHSLGSLAFYLEPHEILYTGDNVGSTVLLFGYGAADQKTYIATMDRLLKLPFQAIYGSHKKEPMSRADLQRCRRVAAEAVYETGTPFPNPIRDGEDAKTCCLPGMTQADEKNPEFAAIILTADK